ncbi:expressed unknown protein [Seminavis robusta]|uniref:VWFD domain-containing protein n=1 Tax=Seminavis robusta TaxID=568900 RepID=A0A9N8EJ28_9STRA|nr:expressed unknown protein [Seminavis robusta]|eukprot:Sro1014_g231450.1 n/a (737) ;mRNA; f:25974-28262
MMIFNKSISYMLALSPLLVGTSTAQGCFKGTAATVTQACVDNSANCCNGAEACSWPDTLDMTVCSNSCNGDAACKITSRTGKDDHAISVASGSCIGKNACFDLSRGYNLNLGVDSSVASFSCISESACQYLYGNVGTNSCLNGENACGGVGHGVGNDSCHGFNVCLNVKNGVGSNTCFGRKTCHYSVGPFGNGSCTDGEYSCQKATGEVANCVRDCSNNYCPVDEGSYNPHDGTCQYFNSDLFLNGGDDSVTTTVDGCFQGTADGVTKACFAGNADCCEGDEACVWPDTLDMTVCPGSCNGDAACKITSRTDKDDHSVVIKGGSCLGDSACYDLSRGYNQQIGVSMQVKSGSCLSGAGVAACRGAYGDIAKNSCVGNRACTNLGGGVGNDSCHGEQPCIHVANGVGSHSCLGRKTCFYAEGSIGNGSCPTGYSCNGATGDIGDCVATCNKEACPEDEGRYDALTGTCSDLSTPAAFAKGDPHMKTFGGEMYDFHGECDLVLLQNPEFKSKLGMDIHIRTKITDWWSSIETAAIKLGDDTLEIRASPNSDEWLWINGTLLADIPEGQWGRAKLAGFLVRYKQSSPKVREAIIYLEGHKGKIVFKTFSSFVRVDVDWKDSENYDGSMGLLGSYDHDGARIGRGGEAIKDVIEFGQDWQVLETEPQLFHSYQGAVLPPNKCTMALDDEAKAALRGRRLAEGMSHAKAEAACNHLEGADEKAACVFDVLATQDLNMASAW